MPAYITAFYGDFDYCMKVVAATYSLPSLVITYLNRLYWSGKESRDEKRTKPDKQKLGYLLYQKSDQAAVLGSNLLNTCQSAPSSTTPR